MSTLAIITMVCVLGLVWGGLLYMIRLAARYEKRKKEQDV
jgi:hypothetical protein